MIYFIQQGWDGPVKIGFAGSFAAAQARLQTFQTGHPSTLRLLNAIDGDMAHEAELHARFAEHRVRGEWFRPAPEILALCDPLPSPDAVAESVRWWRSENLICDDGRLSVQGEIYLHLIEQFAVDDDARLHDQCELIDIWLSKESIERQQERAVPATTRIAA